MMMFQESNSVTWAQTFKFTLKFLFIRELITLLKGVIILSHPVTGYPAPVVSWRKTCGPLAQGRVKYNNSVLQILHVRKDDTDLYYCAASNLLGRVEKKTFLVVVSPPRFIVKPPAKVVALAGGILILNCSATGDPQPVVTWKKQGQLSVRRSQQINGDLVIRSVPVNDKGIYSCVATNAGVFKAEADTFIEVTGKSVGKTREDILFRTMQRLIERSLCIKCHKRH